MSDYIVNSFSTFTEAWLRTGKQLAISGSKTAPRNHESLEFCGHQMLFPMSTCILMCPLRKLGFRFMYREAWWILSGSNRLFDIESACPPMSLFSDDGVFLKGAYGPKVVDQLPYVIQTLVEDPDSRQAVINIWRERPGPSKDIPCTLSIQFLLRNNHINTIVTMRSSDIWLGLPYDVFAVTMIAAYVALEVGNRRKESCGIGVMSHTAGSRHLYLKDKDKMIEATHPKHIAVALDKAMHPVRLIRASHLRQRFDQSHIGYYEQLIDSLWVASLDHKSAIPWLNYATNPI